MNDRKRSIFRVCGGNPVSGEIKPQGNKNEVLPALSASLLTNEKICLNNIPFIEDVQSMLEILNFIGVKVVKLEKETNQLSLEISEDIDSKLPAELCSTLRGSITLAGPILARNGEVFLPRPGGDRIGRRRLDTHFLALEALGVKRKVFSDGYELKYQKLIGADILLDEASVTGTENVICAAVKAEGTTVIRNAACEPHVQGLCRLLKSMGAQINGIGSNILTIEGVEKLCGTDFTIAPDYLEAGSFIALAGLTRGELKIEYPASCIEDLRIIRMIFMRLGIQTKYENGFIVVPKEQSLEVVNDLDDAVPRIDSSPWPGFPADMTSVALVTATQARGTVLIHEKMFESRLFFTDRLIAMGARIILCDPHRAVVMGPSPLHSADISTPDIRAGMALLLATLCAKGVSYIQNVIQIDRGFFNIENRLASVGADIVREE